jgi:hypothetical protein
MRWTILVLLVGCVPTSYTYTPASKRMFNERPKGCEFEVFPSPPERAYDEVGDLQHYNGDVPKNVDDFKKAVASQVCGVGGDAVYVTRSDKGEITKATIIHWTQKQ